MSMKLSIGNKMMIDPNENRLMVFEDQVSDFYGMRNKLEDFLSFAGQGEGQEEGIKEDFQPGRKKYQLPAVQKNLPPLPQDNKAPSYY